MRESYEKPMLEVNKFDVEDVITESGAEVSDIFTTNSAGSEVGDEI